MSIPNEFDNWLANQDSFWEFLLKATGYHRKQKILK